MNMTKEKQTENRIRVFGFKYTCSYIGHACAAQLYAYAYACKPYAYACKQYAHAYTPKNPNPETVEQKPRN